MLRESLCLGFFLCHVQTYKSVSKTINIYEVGMRIIQLLWDSEMSAIHMLLYSGTKFEWIKLYLILSLWACKQIAVHISTSVRYWQVTCAVSIILDKFHFLHSTYLKLSVIQNFKMFIIGVLATEIGRFSQDMNHFYFGCRNKWMPVVIVYWLPKGA